MTIPSTADLPKIASCLHNKGGEIMFIFRPPNPVTKSFNFDIDTIDMTIRELKIEFDIKKDSGTLVFRGSIDTDSVSDALISQYTSSRSTHDIELLYHRGIKPLLIQAGISPQAANAALKNHQEMEAKNRSDFDFVREINAAYEWRQATIGDI